MHKSLSLFGALALAGLITGCSTTAPAVKTDESIAQPAMQTSKHFRKTFTRTAELNYLLFLPEGYKKSGDKWPLMLFLHGAGERGTNVQKVTVHGPPKLVKSKKDFPFILVSPQCAEGRTWNDEELLALLDEISSKYNVDSSRVYVTGLSMGGYGTWSLGTKYPERFAAIAPICGGGEPIHLLLASKEKRAALKGMGVWAFHGAKDTIVRLEESQRMTNALMRAGCTNVKLTVYPEAGHDSWTDAYEKEPGLWNWFLSHRRP